MYILKAVEVKERCKLIQKLCKHKRTAKGVMCHSDGAVIMANVEHEVAVCEQCGKILK